MPVPVPSQVTLPESGTIETLEIATPGATPTFMQVPLVDSLDRTANESSETFTPLGTFWNMNVTTGGDYNINFETAGKDDDPALSLLYDAAFAADASSRVLFFRVKNADGSYLSGNMNVGMAGWPNAVRGVRKIQFNCKSTGDVTRTSAANAV